MDVPAYVESHAREFVDELKQWLAIPSISADPARHPDVRRSAEWLAAHLRDAGFPVAEVWETGGLPAVFAEWPAADRAAPAVLIYGHHSSSRSSRWPNGTARRSPRPNATARSWPAAPPTTRARC